MPYVVAIAGPNGAGKSTIAEAFLRDLLNVSEYVNADTIARGLSQFEPEKVAIEAGRLNLRRLEELANSGDDFAFETTLSGRAYVARIRRWKEMGYRFLLFFFWLTDVNLAVGRVAKRVRSGGHSIPEDVIRTRHQRGIENFFDLYRNLADAWVLYDNSGRTRRLMASTPEDSDELKNIEELFLDHELVTAALTRGVNRALWRHKQLGESIVIWEDGKVVEIPPEEIDVEKPD